MHIKYSKRRTDKIFKTPRFAAYKMLFTREIYKILTINITRYENVEAMNKIFVKHLYVYNKIKIRKINTVTAN